MQNCPGKGSGRTSLRRAGVGGALDDDCADVGDHVLVGTRAARGLFPLAVHFDSKVGRVDTGIRLGKVVVAVLSKKRGRSGRAPRRRGGALDDGCGDVGDHVILKC